MFDLSLGGVQSLDVDYHQFYGLESYLFDVVGPRFGDDGHLGAFDLFSIIIWKANRAKSRLARRLLEVGGGTLEDAARQLTTGLAAREEPKERLRYLLVDWGLLIAAPRGGEAMIEVLEQTLLCHATEALLSEQGVKAIAQDGELADSHSRGYEVLRDFLLHRMRMSHVYQPVMLKTLIENGGATVREIAAAFLALDESQLEYYEHVTKTMPGRVLARHGLVRKEHDRYTLTVDLEDVTEDERRELMEICEQAVADYLRKRGERLYDHRRQAAGQISGSDRYEVLKRAGGRCELCGVSMEERRLEVDHIIPRSLGGSDDPSNLQALCWLCNATKEPGIQPTSAECARCPTDETPAVTSAPCPRRASWPRTSSPTPCTTLTQPLRFTHSSSPSVTWPATSPSMNQNGVP